MNIIGRFIKSTFLGGVLVLLPLAIIVVIIQKIFAFFKYITDPLSEWLPRNVIPGLDGHNLLAVLLILLACFLCGLLFHFMFMQKSISVIETNVLSFIPGYLVVKSFITAKLHAESRSQLPPILLLDGEGFRPGLLVEETDDGDCVVFLPDVPKCEGGEVRITTADRIVKLKMPGYLFTDDLSKMGKGLAEHVKASHTKK